MLATYAYDNLGQRSSLTRGNGTVTGYSFDQVGRLATLTEDMASTGNDQSVAFSYNPASQIASLTKANDAYAWTGHGNGSTASVANGLNQLTSIGGTATTHDSKGNVTFDPMSGKTYAYSSENLLTSSSGGTSAALAYDPAMRLYQVTAGATTRFAYDGLNLIAEYDGSNALQHRYVFGPAVDEPLVQYDGSGTANRSWMHSDERGSIIAISDGSGAATQINKYDEYGKPQSSNAGRFQYTGQLWLPEIGAYYYKARFYSPVFGGRFLQTDPIDIAGGINLYAYVGNDPVNKIDPRGLKWVYSCVGLEGGAMSCGWHDNGDPTLRSFDIVLIIGSILDSPDVPSSEGSEKRTPCTPTTDQLKNSGPVTFGGVSSSAYFLLGFGGTQGTFTTQSGLAGDFTATAFGFGLGPSFAVTGGMDDSLASFMGGSDNINIGAFGAEATFSQSIYGGPLRFDSGTLGTDLGLGAVLANALKTPSLASVNVSVTFEVTEISNVTCPVE